MTETETQNQSPNPSGEGAESQASTDATPPAPMRRWLSRCRRPAIWCVEGLAMVTGIAVILALALTWRLSSGPLAIDFLTEEIEHALSAAAAPMEVELGAITILWDEREKGLRLAGQSVRLRGETGRLIASFPRVDISLAIPSLLRGQFVVTEATLQQPLIRLTRDQSGRIAIDFAADDGVTPSGNHSPGNNPVDSQGITADDAPLSINGFDALTMAMRVLAPPDDIQAFGPSLADSGAAALSQLRRVKITDARFELSNPQAGKKLRLSDVNLVASRSDVGLTMAGQAQLRTGDGAPVSRIEGFIDIHGVDQTLDLDINLRDIDLIAANRLGLGQLPEWVRDMPLDRARLQASVNDGDGTFHLDKLSVDLADSTVDLRASGYRAVAADGALQWRGAGVLRLDRLDVPAWLGRLPEDMDVPGIRWSKENFTQGQLVDVEVLIDGVVPEDQPMGFTLDRVTGRFGLEDATVRYQWALPPATEVYGTGRFDDEAVIINLTEGQIDTVTASETELRIADFEADFPSLVVNGRAQGPFKDVMTALNHPRFGYADYLSLDLEQVGGTLDAQMRFALPLKPSLPAEEVEVDISGQLIDVRTNALFAGLPIREANLQTVIDGDGLVAKGTVTAGGIPLTINWHQYFQASADIGTALDFRGTMTDEHLAGLGFNPAPYLTGPIGVDGRVIDYNGGDTEIQATATLDEALLTIPPLKLEREAVPGSLLLAVQVKPDNTVVVSSASLSTAELNADGSAKFNNDGSFGVQASRIAWGETRLSLGFEQDTAGAWDVVLNGPRLDLRPLLDDPEATARADETADTSDSNTPDVATDGAEVAADQDNQAIATFLREAAQIVGADKPDRQLTINVDEVVKSNQAVWQNVQGRAIMRARQWPSILLQADLSGSPFTLEVSGADRDPLQMRMSTKDLGTLMAAYDADIPIIAGQFDFQAHGEPWSEGPIALTGRVALDDFRLGTAPVLVRTVDALSQQGLRTLNRDAGLGFDRFVADVRLSGSTITVNEGRAGGGPFGFTIGGVVDLAGQQLDLNGTLVPVYTLNRWISAIPIIGTLLTGGDGEGLFAATYSVDGDFDDPDIAINPLSALAPGIIRKLLFAEQSNTSQEAANPEDQKPLEPPQGMVDHGG
ncbi:MAG: AsmA-like C-terminal domain-containing protein [Pseudomonadota bacterium]